MNLRSCRLELIEKLQGSKNFMLFRSMDTGSKTSWRESEVVFILITGPATTENQLDVVSNEHFQHVVHNFKLITVGVMLLKPPGV